MFNYRRGTRVRLLCDMPGIMTVYVRDTDETGTTSLVKIEKGMVGVVIGKIDYDGQHSAIVRFIGKDDVTVIVGWHMVEKA